MKVIHTGTETGAGSAFKLATASDIHTVQIEFTGTITALTVVLNGGLSSTKLVAIQTYALNATEIAAKAAVFHVANRLLEYIQGEITVLTGTGTVTITHSPANDQALKI